MYPNFLIAGPLLLLLASFNAPAQFASGTTNKDRYIRSHGAIVRGDTSRREVALVFTGDHYSDGGNHITGILEQKGIKGSFFLTGRFYREPEFAALIRSIAEGGHYLGAHSDQHLLYCSWENRDSLLVSREEFRNDLLANYRAMDAFGISAGKAPLFLPPFEWYNDTVSAWTSELGLKMINYTPGTLSHADYTIPDRDGYRSSLEIYRSIMHLEERDPAGLNGFILLMHIGTSEERTDKFHLRLEALITELMKRGYRFLRVDQLLDPRE